ncbi:hypothetical protein GQX73_g4872 [Xylaria multiplex]|uniref:Uncharacterized protein n=1 Tax=Xylaria multiplex TaxID=323545 RepID=A0A7C8N5A0_9PEZI|nr:hypothetical protein GQX73_g4872 [Xylaria multiplex]
MIARGAPVGAVCFRCRLRLLRQLTPIRSIASDASDATPTQHVGDPTDGKASHDAEPDAEKHRSPRPKGKVVMKRINLHKQHLSRNRILNEAAASLGTNMLGKPAYAIVMKDGGDIRRRKTQLPSLKDEAELSSDQPADIEALRESDRQAPALNEDFLKLQQLLSKGFLSAQLLDYMVWHQSGARHKAQKVAIASPSDSEFPWITKKLPWAPLKSELNESERTVGNPTLQGYISDVTPPKDKLVIRIMRDCWGLSIAELETRMGSTQITLRSHEFTLLMRGTQRFMNTLGKFWLDPGEKIEAIQGTKTLHITTTRPKAESIIRDLDELLQSVKTKAFPLVLVGSEVPDQVVLEKLGQMTNSYVEPSHTSRRLQVTWIELASRAARGLTALEDVAHIVFRLLLTASGFQQPTSTLLSPARSQAYPGRLAADVTSNGKLGWKDRLAQWARYVLPVTPENGAVDKILPIKELELPFEPLERPEVLKENLEFFPDTKFPFHPVKWSSVIQTSTTAHFGHILHSYEPSNSTPSLSDLLASTDRRVFAPLAPHPLQLTKIETDDPDNSLLVTTKSTLILRFWPSPSTDPVSGPRAKKSESKRAGDTPPAPILELRLAASDRSVKGVESLRAISRTHHTDIMLPSSLVDVRFTQVQYETLQARDSEAFAGWQPFVDFLQNARLELHRGKLEMPPRQRFPIPRRLFAADTFPEGADLDDLESISYEFVGLEMHRSVTLPYEGHQMTYTSIEAGQGGGRRAEITLEPLKQTEAVDKDQLQEQFLACCSRFATDRSLWSGISNNKGKM